MQFTVRVADKSFSLTESINNLNWTCSHGTCTARGAPKLVNAKSCIALGAELGVNIESFEYDGKTLDNDSLAYCRLKLADRESKGAFIEVRERRKVAASSSHELAASESYLEIGSSVGQLGLLAGGLRFVFVDGSAVWLAPNGELFRFDADRRLVDHGTFVRWYSPQGYFTSPALFGNKVTERPCNVDQRVSIVKGQVLRSWTLMPACQQPEDFQLIFKRSPASTQGFGQAKRALFSSPWSEDKAWPSTVTPATASVTYEVLVGSVETEPHYDGDKDDMLQHVTRVISQCTDQLRPKLPKLKGQGELLLVLNAYGKPRTALVRRYTYGPLERFNACIEQKAMTLSLQNRHEVTIRLPFDVIPPE
jgi:hypothetical protein